MDGNRKIALVALIVLAFYQYSEGDFKISPQEPQVQEEILPIPDAEMQQKVANLRSYFAQNANLALEASHFYVAFSDLVSRNPRKFLKNSADFREYNQLALDMMFQKSAFIGAVPGLDAEIDKTLQSVVSLDPTAEIDNKKLANLLYAIGWVAYDALRETPSAI